MVSFNAANALEPLDFNFAPYDEARGTVPEPSDERVAAYYAGLGKVMESALGAERTADVDLTDPVQVGKLFATFTAEDHQATYTEVLELHAAVCDGRPDREQLSKLPFRLRQAFYGMVQEWLRPEGSRPATTK